MTTKEIQRAIGKRQVLRGHNPVCENVKYLLNHWEMDVLSVSSAGFTYEFEVKVSRADFKADLRKERKHRTYVKGDRKLAPNYFSYVCLEGLITLAEVPTHAGLYYLIDGEPFEVKAPPRLHAHKLDQVKLTSKVNQIYSERAFLDGICKMTYLRKALPPKPKRREKRK